MMILQTHTYWRQLLTGLLLVISTAAFAQHDAPQQRTQVALASDSLSHSVVADSVVLSTEAPMSDVQRPEILFDLPNLGYASTLSHSPWSLMPSMGYGFWPIHQGFNAQIGMDLSVGLGKHAPEGVGFGQHVAAIYAKPLGDRFVVAGGIFAANMDWGNFHRTEAGVGALLSYRLNERVTLFGYGIKSFAPERDNHFAHQSPFVPNFGDRIGVGADFKIGEAASITVAFEHRSGPGAIFGPAPLPPMKPYGQE